MSLWMISPLSERPFAAAASASWSRTRLADGAEIDPKCCLFQLPSLAQAVGLSRV